MKFLYGDIVSGLPKGYTPPEMWPEYGVISEPPPACRREIVQDNPVAIRWCIWPLCFERHVGDKEPDLVQMAACALAYNRFIGWRRLTNSPTPPGWHKALPGTYRIDGYQTLHKDDFTARWHKNARRDLRLWQDMHVGTTHTIDTVSWDEYAEAYKKSLVATREGAERLENLKHKLALPLVRANTILYGVRCVRDGRVIAGTAVIYSPQYKSSTHFAPFILPEARSVYAATALMHHWFAESLARDCPTVMTTNFWHPGKPKSWKGFSEFKSHFGFEFYTYPPLLWRFVRGKLW